MRGLLERFSQRREYRVATIVLGAGCILPFLLLLGLSLPRSWVGAAFVIGTVSYVTLFVLTYFRLQSASVSTWWLLLMIVILPVGPSWVLTSSELIRISFAPSGLIPLVPVLIGCFAADTSRRV
jgi:uncharacterized membrane protein YhaH (DUF805 family)